MSEIEMVSFLLLFGAVVCLSIFSYSFIETPMRQARTRQSITFVFSLGSLAVLALVGCIVMFNNSFPNRFAEYAKANIWSDIHKCHGASRISELEDYLLECLQDSSSSPTVYLLGDSHAHQLIFPIRSISAQFSFNVNFLNTENWSMFPHNLISGQFDGSDEVFTRLTDNLSSDDIIFIAFHRGRFNSVRDQHIPIHETVVENDEENNFISNFYKANDFFERMGVSVILILDAPLLPDSVLIERCYNIRALRSACNIDLRQDLHTRQRQQRAAEHLANSFENVHIFDAALPLYANGSFSPITNDRQYLMFDRHHLTELGSMYLRESLSRFFYENLITLELN